MRSPCGSTWRDDRRCGSPSSTRTRSRVVTGTPRMSPGRAVGSGRRPPMDVGRRRRRRHHPARRPRLTQLVARPRDRAASSSPRAPACPTLIVDEPADGPKEFVRVFSSHAAAPAGAVADTEWSSAFLGRPVRLVWQADPTGRTVGGDTAGRRAGQLRRRLPDAAGERGVAGGAQRLAGRGRRRAGADDPVPAQPGGRRRARPWAEDEWVGRRLRIGGVVLRAARLVQPLPGHHDRPGDRREGVGSRWPRSAGTAASPTACSSRSS